MTIDHLREFRQRVYECRGRARDAQFELVDALLLNSEGRSVVELSLNRPFGGNGAASTRPCRMGR